MVLPLGWLIDPQSKIVKIYRSSKIVELLKNPTDLFGEDVLPSFLLSLPRVYNYKLKIEN